MEMEHKLKLFSYKIADIDGKQRTVKFYYGAFDNVDFDGDVLRKGATIKTVKENGPNGKDIIRHFLNHEFRTNPGVLPIGKIKEMGEDNFGPWAVSKIARTANGNDIYSMYEDGFINNHSMGFNPVKTRPGNDYNEITEIKLFEVSTVTTWAANANTPTIEVKEAGQLPTSHNNSNALSFIKPSTMTLKEEAAMSEFMKELWKSNLFNELKL
jgi:HK97 family phage prohead protease